MYPPFIAMRRVALQSCAVFLGLLLLAPSAWAQGRGFSRGPAFSAQASLQALAEAGRVGNPQAFLQAANQYFHGTPTLPQPVVAFPAAQAGGIGTREAVDREEMLRRIELAARKNEVREERLVGLLRHIGFGEDQIHKQEVRVFGQKAGHNYWVDLPGKTDQVLVLGAHWDKVAAGMGVIDNFTGVVMGLNLAQYLKDVSLNFTVRIMWYAAEERGLVGSREYVRTLKREAPEEFRKIVAMLNLDTLAVNAALVWKNRKSDPNFRMMILKAAEAVQRATKLREAALSGGDSDSSSFWEEGIAAATVFGATEDVIWEILHSENDNLNAFNLDIFEDTYWILIEVLHYLDRNWKPAPAVA